MLLFIGAVRFALLLKYNGNNLFLVRYGSRLNMKTYGLIRFGKTVKPENIREHYTNTVMEYLTEPTESVKAK